MDEREKMILNLQLDRDTARYEVQRRAAEIRSEYRKIATGEVKREREKQNAWFAGKIRKAIEAGLSRGDVRREVLRTNDWGTWVKWAELAGVDPSMRKDKGVSE